MISLPVSSVSQELCKCFDRTESTPSETRESSSPGSMYESESSPNKTRKSSLYTYKVALATRTHFSENGISSCLKFAVGELFGNPALLLDLLMEKKIIQLPNEHYIAFYQLQKWFKDPSLELSLDELFLKIGDIQEIFQYMTFTERTRDCFFVLLGEGLISDSPIDFLTLYFLQWLDENAVSYDIMLSRSSLPFLHFFEDYTNSSKDLQGGDFGELHGSEMIQEKPEITFWSFIGDCSSKNRCIKSIFDAIHSSYINHVKLLSVVRGPNELFLCGNQVFFVNQIFSLIHEIAKSYLQTPNNICEPLTLEAERLQFETGLLGNSQESDMIHDIICGNRLFQSLLLKQQVGTLFFQDSLLKALTGQTGKIEPLNITRGTSAISTFIVHADRSDEMQSRNLIGLTSSETNEMSSIDVLEFKESVFEGLIEHEINLEEYPQEFQITPTAFVIGDLHANPLLLIYVLILKHIMLINEKDYMALMRVINSFNDFKFSPKIIEDLNECLSKIQFCDNVEHIRMILLGDELADRSGNDYVMLRLFELLDKHKMPFEIILSNHGIEHIRYGICGYPKPIDPKRMCIWLGDDSYAISLVRLFALFTHFPQLQKEVADIFKNVYMKRLKLLSYYLDKNSTVSLIYHGCSSLEKVELLAQNFYKYINQPNKLFVFQTTDALTQSIDNLNEAVYQNSLAFFYDVLSTMPSENPLYHLIWNRHGQTDEERSLKQAFESMFEKIKVPYPLRVIHGHAGQDKEIPSLSYCTINLDGNRGKPKNDQGSFLPGILRTVDWF